MSDTTFDGIAISTESVFRTRVSATADIIAVGGGSRLNLITD
jgi:hypothetical protein